MSSANVNFKKLNQQADELYSLIHATNAVLHDAEPVSVLRVNVEEKISDLASDLKKNFTQYAKMAYATGRIKETIVIVTAGGALAGAAWVGAAGIDAARNGIAKAQARKALLGYYQQLASKQSMIISEHQKVNREMAAAIAQLQENETENREKIRVLQARQAELSDLLYRFDKLKNLVEN